MWHNNDFIEPTALENVQQAIRVLTNEHEKNS